MYIEAIVLGFIIGGLRNGRLANFSNARFRGWFLAVVALVLFLMPYIGILLFSAFENSHLLTFSAMVVIALLVIVNLDHKGMIVVLIGLLSNVVVMAMNGFKMPIDLEAMTRLGFESFAQSVTSGTVVNYIDLLNAEPWTVYLSKFIALPDFYPLANVFSMGDVIISIGIVILIQNEMLLHSMKTKGSMIQFSYGGGKKRF